jgi:drug/metabolite transporter (DMT)-like permease
MSVPFLGTGEIYSILCALLWAIAVVLFRKSGDDVPPAALNFFKNVVGLLLFAASMAVANTEWIPKGQASSDWVLLFVSGAVGIGIADTFFFMSLNRIGAGKMAILDSAYSPLVAVWSFFLLSDTIGHWLLVAMGLMLLAIVIGTWERKKPGGAQGKRDVWAGVSLGLLGLLLMAFGIVIAKPVLNHCHPTWGAAVRFVGGLSVLSLWLFRSKSRREILAAFRPSRAWRVTIPSAVFGSYLSMYFWLAGVKYTQTTIASVLNQLSTIFILIMATVFLKEKLTIRKALAIALGFSAGILATW